MKSFFDLPLHRLDPSTALHIEDGLHHVVDMSDYDGPRGMAEILAKSAKASDLRELTTIASSLNHQNVFVIRLNREAGGTGFYHSSSFNCLDEHGIFLFSICETDLNLSHSAYDLATRFAWNVARYENEHVPRWKLLTTFKSALIHGGLRYIRPEWMREGGAPFPMTESDWWGLGVPATIWHIEKFSDLILKNSERWDQTQSLIFQADQWLSENSGGFNSIGDLLDSFT